MASAGEPYDHVGEAMKRLRKARELKAAGDAEKAFEALCETVERVIKDYADELDELEQRYHDLDSRLASVE